MAKNVSIEKPKIVLKKCFGGILTFLRFLISFVNDRSSGKP